MKKFLSFALLFILFLLAINFTSAWTGYTHDWICNNAGLSNLDCHSADNVQVQKEYPGLGFVNHHCTNNSNLCSARKSALKFKEMGTPETAGFAAHLYADALVPVHWHSHDSCHSVFEKKIEEALKSTGRYKIKIFSDVIYASYWSVNMTCYAKDIDENVALYADSNYMEYVVNSVSVSMDSEIIEFSPKVYDLTWIVVVILFIFVLLLILFFIMGFRNKKKK